MGSLGDPAIPKTGGVGRRPKDMLDTYDLIPIRRALCSAHPCTPDAWTNGPYVTWVLCILVPMVHTPRGRSGATFVKVLAQSECGQFCHFGICGPNWDCHHAGWHGDLWKPMPWESRLDSGWIAYGMADQISKPAWRYTIGNTPKFWLISGSQNDPISGPQFHPPRVVNWWPHISMPTWSPDPIPGCTLG